MSEANVSDFLIRRLSDWGTKRIFGYSGDGINGLLAAIQRTNGMMEFVQPPHEELASLMACGHAKFTGEAAVCLATSGPGAIHLLNGLYDAKSDLQPVVAIVGQQPNVALGSGAQQEIDLHSLFKDVASAYLETISSPEQVQHVVDRAFRTALARRTVTAIIVPRDVQLLPSVEEPPQEHGMAHSGVGFTSPRVVPLKADLQEAANALNEGKRVAMLIGAGALGARDEVVEVAERLQAGVAKALLGKSAVEDDLPFVTGSVGWLGTAASNEMLQECDTLFMVGSGFPYSEFLPKPGTVRGVQIDIDPGRLSLRYPMDVALAGDTAETLRALLPLLEQKPVGEWRPNIEEKVRNWWQTVERNAQIEAPELNPELPFVELAKRLPSDALITADSGTAAYWLGRSMKLKRGMHATLSGTLATMGSGVPYALAAKLAHPGRPVFALVGDGAMQMGGMNMLFEVARRWRQWPDPNFVVLVLNNRDLNYVTWEQRAMDGEPRFDASQDVPDFGYAAFAEMLGLRGIRVDAASGVAPAWDRAMIAGRPVVFEAVVSRDVPTLPPALTEMVASKMKQALEADDPDADEVERQLEARGIGVLQ